MTFSLKIVLGSLCFCAAGAMAQTIERPTIMPWGSAIGLIENVSLEISDGVSDNCWTNANLIRSNAFLKFEQNGIFVPDYEPQYIDYKTPKAVINAYGGRGENGRCTVAAQFLVYHASGKEYGGANGKEEFYFPFLVTVFDDSAVLTNSTNVNEQLSDFFEEQINEFIAKGISERRNPDFRRYLELYPDTDELPMSVEDFDEMFGNSSSGSSD